jgi:CRP/FNR family transcriptional regulator/CRP/FNR family cyclic AMP-dependent transcriptional regulator
MALKKNLSTASNTAVNGYKKCFFKLGQQILEEGDIGEEMFIISKGSVEVSKNVDGKRVILMKLGRGEFFGEMSLLEGLTRSADVFAIEDSELISISSGGLLLKIRRDPTFAIEMLRSFSGRLRIANEKYGQQLTKAYGKKGNFV